MEQIFKDLNVLELASVLAGPATAQFFAELGAEVIKIENVRTGGDVTRSWRGATEQTDDRSAYFCSVNWGKKSLALDLTTTEGKEIVQQLARQADVLIASYKPGDAEKLGVGYQQLKAINKNLIYGQITGYGSDDDRVGYDAVIQAEAGFMDLNGERDGEPLKMPVALIDVLAAHHLKEALLLALLKKERTGEGSFVEVSLIHAAVTSLVNQASNWLVAKSLPKRQGSLHPNIAPYGESFTTKDDKRILVAIGSDRQFADLCAILNLPSLPNDERFTINQNRIKNRHELYLLLKEQMEQQQSASLMHQIHKKKIPAGIIQNMKEVFEMKEAQALLIQSGNLLGVRSFAGIEVEQGLSSTNHLLPPPHLGQHNKEILAQLNR